jgi:hypothetical protein
MHFTASTASVLALLIVTAAPSGVNAKTGATPMAPSAVQAVAASGSSKGAPLFVAADPDLVAKEGVAQDSWSVVSHLMSGSDRLDLLIHYIRLTPPQDGPVIQAIVSVLDPVSGKLLAEERTGMVTPLMQKSFGRLSSNRSSKANPPSESARLTIRVLAPMWIGFICGAFAGAVIVSSFHSVGLLGIVVPLVLLIGAEMRTKVSV